MASLIPRGPPAPPPPRSSAPSGSGDNTLAPPVPPQRRPSHRSVKSHHYNDAPEELDLALKRAGGGGGSQKRTRATSRVVADPSTLQAAARSPEPRSASTESASSSEEPVYPAFEPNTSSTPPPPPEARLHRRYGPPRSTGADSQAQWPADVLLLDQLAFAEPTKLVLLFVTGNPGLVAYYRHFLASLRDALPADLKAQTVVHAIGHLGHTPDMSASERRGFNPAAQATLEDQVADKVAYVEELAETYRFGQDDAPKLVLLGHSIGAWISMQVMKERPSLVSSVHALFPTISHMAKTKNGLFYSTSFLSYLPTGLTSRIVSLLTGQSGAGAQTTTELVSSPESVLAALVMARHELGTVTDLDTEVLEQYGDRLWFYWAAEGNDGWVTEEAVEEIEACLESRWGEDGRKRRARCQEEIPHAFVLNDAHSNSLAQKCASWIVDDLEPAPSPSRDKDTA
ncbi:hypothetical protein JCM8202v2_002468 [Rhodotorula sphaerocarpa]